MIYISSDESGEVSDEWESDYSTDTEQLIEKIEREVRAIPVLIDGRIMTVEEEEEEMVADTSTSPTSKLGPEYFDEKFCNAPKKENALQLIQLCRTTIQVADSPMSPPEMGRQWKPRSDWGRKLEL